MLARLRDYRGKQDEATIAKALTGTWRHEHLFLLRQSHQDYRHHQQAMEECDRQINELIANLPQRGDDDPELPAKRATGKNDFHFDAQDAAYRLTGVDLVAIDGIGPNTALNLLGEIGFDLSP